MLSGNMVECPTSGLILPRSFVDEKQALKKVIDEFVERCLNEFQHIDGTYFLTLHAKFDKFNPDNFNVNEPIVTKKLPPFLSNTFVWRICNRRGICELLWMVPPKKRGGKLKVEFNTTGVAYLQAKGAMPS